MSIFRSFVSAEQTPLIVGDRCRGGTTTLPSNEQPALQLPSYLSVDVRRQARSDWLIEDVRGFLCFHRSSRGSNAAKAPIHPYTVSRKEQIIGEANSCRTRPFVTASLGQEALGGSGSFVFLLQLLLYLLPRIAKQP